MLINKQIVQWDKISIDKTSEKIENDDKKIRENDTKIRFIALPRNASDPYFRILNYELCIMNYDFCITDCLLGA